MTNERQQAAIAITAGNIKIDKDDNIVFFSNKSGDFHPSWDSLQYGISAMLACDLPIADTIEIEKFENGKPMEVLTFTFDGLKKELCGLSTFFQNELYQDTNNNLLTRVSTYPKEKDCSTEQKNPALNFASCRGKLNFSDKPTMQNNLFSDKDYFAEGSPTKSYLTTRETFFSNKNSISKQLLKDNSDCSEKLVAKSQDEQSEDSYEIW